MSSNLDPREERVVSQDREASVSRLIWSMADTTWRMFTPPAIFVSLGIFLDLRIHTKPWMTLLSLVVGLFFSVMLVKKQLGSVK